MNIHELLEKCRERHEKPLSTKLSVMHAKMGDVLHPYHPQVYYARGKSTMATSFAEAGIGILPVMSYGHPPKGYSELGWTITRTMQHAPMWQWKRSYGLQVMTGEPSGDWTDLDFEWAAVEQHPEQLEICLLRLCALADTPPLITITKSGGIRFSCRTPGYVHPNGKPSQEFVAEYYPELTEVNGKLRPVRKHLFLEVFGNMGKSRYDARYEIYAGNIFSPPVISYESLFGVLSYYKRAVDVPPPDVPVEEKMIPIRRSKRRVAISQDGVPVYALGTLPRDLHWTRRIDGKPGLQSKRGDYVCGMTVHSKSNGSLQFYLQPDGVVDMYCHNCGENGFVGRYEKSEEERVAALIANAPPYESIPTPEEQKHWRIERIRSGDLSPMALLRPTAILEKRPSTLKFSTLEINDMIIRDAFDEESKLVVINAETGAGKNFQLEDFIIKGGKVLKTTPTYVLAVADETRMLKKGIDVFLWKGRDYLWELQEERTETQLLADPFINGAMCIDAARCNSLFLKGGSAKRSICPNCPVYDMCQSKGYLSQEEIAVLSEVIVISMKDLFFNPDRGGFAERLLKEIEVVKKNDQGEVVWEKVQRIGTIDEAKAHEFYLRKTLAKSQLQAWRDMWQDKPLCEFAKDMLDILEVQGFSVKRVRSYISGIEEEQAEKLYHQMKHVNVEYEVIDRGVSDKETQAVLAHISAKFKPSGAKVYIAKDWGAYKLLWSKDVACLPPDEYKKTGYLELTQALAIRFGIYPIDTESDVNKVPWVAGAHTPLHQLQEMLTHYIFDTNAPMDYYGDELVWHIPPILNEKVSTLVMMSATLNLEHTQRAFPDEKSLTLIETSPTVWKPGSRVFQIRTGAYPRKTLLEYDDDNNAIGLRDIAKKFLDFIEHNIYNDPTRKHAIITFKPIMNWYEDDWKDQYENVLFFGQFGQMEGLSEVFDEADTFWIIGTPEVGKLVLEAQVNLLYGNDAGEISYERDDTRVFVDPRVQSVYEAIVVAMLQQAVGRARMNRFENKRVIIFSAVDIPTITGRTETLLFDFADCEIAGNIDRLEDCIRERENAERDMIHEIAEIEELLLEGMSSYSLIADGYPEYTVKKIMSDLADEIQVQRGIRQEDIDAYVRQLSREQRPLREIERATGLTRYMIKKMLDE